MLVVNGITKDWQVLLVPNRSRIIVDWRKNFMIVKSIL
jgi:hypothetical protein